MLKHKDQDYFGHTVSRVIKDILRQNGFDWQALSEFFRYKRVDQYSARFSLSYNGKEKLRCTLLEIPELEVDGDFSRFGIHVDILSGACKGRYKFANTFLCDRIIDNLCDLHDYPNVKAIDGMGMYIGSFAWSIKKEDNSFLLKRGEFED